jgi:hypothetical protein
VISSITLILLSVILESILVVFLNFSSKIEVEKLVNMPLMAAHQLGVDYIKTASKLLFVGRRLQTLKLYFDILRWCIIHTIDCNLF